MQLSREKILQAGLEILDTYGLADLTMRRLAKQLGVAPGALYWHFANKQTLIESIARRILNPMLQAPDSLNRAGKPGAADWCRRLRAALLSHRDGAELVGAAAAMTSLHGELLERLAAELPTADPHRGAGAATLLHFVLGTTVLEQSARQAAESTALTTTPEPGTDPGTGDHFNRGLNIILTGLRELPRAAGTPEKDDV